MSNPKIGDMVHYQSYGSKGDEYHSMCRAAVIAGVNGPNNAVDLVVFNPSGLFFNKSPQREDEHVGGSWHWPERV